MKIHTGDIVVINTGKDKGKQGTVTHVLETKNRVVVEGINMRVRHIKKTAQAPGQRLTYEASIHASNVQIIDPKSKKPTRIGYMVDAKTGKKTRVAKKSGEVIMKAVTKAVKPAKKDQAAAVPGRGAFWKRGEKGSGSVEGGATTSAGPNVIQTAHRAQGG